MVDEILTELWRLVRKDIASCETNTTTKRRRCYSYLLSQEHAVMQCEHRTVRSAARQTAGWQVLAQWEGGGVMAATAERCPQRPLAALQDPHGGPSLRPRAGTAAALSPQVSAAPGTIPGASARL